MAKRTIVVCDGCGNELADDQAGSATVQVDEKGSSHTRKIELCAECTGKLPEGTKRKRPERSETPAASSGGNGKRSQARR